MATKLDPWGAVSIDDYSKLFEEFGISSFEELLPQIDDPHSYMKRHIIFGHRDYQRVVEAMNDKRPFAVMSGFMPSGKVHLGGKMVMEEIIWHQKHGGDAFVAIADMEAHSVRGISWQRCRELGIEEYVLSIIALGLEPSATIYFQSKRGAVRDLAFELAAAARFSELAAIYGFSGETNVAHMVSVMVQSADILHPQLAENGGPKPVVIPVGSDQDAHIRLTRDLAARMRKFLVEEREGRVSLRGKAAGPDLIDAAAARLREMGYRKVKRYEEHIDVFDAMAKDSGRVEEAMRSLEVEAGGYGFVPPASLYHRFMTGLTGGKMSSSKPESHIALTEDPEEARKKVMRAVTGGRQSLAEQKKLGGEPDRCTVYELMLFHLSGDEDELKEIFDECKSGKRVCGTCKKEAAERIRSFLVEHQREREIARERLPEFGL
ncbi:MAG: tryptophan--tRNA ligase [Methanothrix sp.]|jgi:tryptophanyl-tRNA synthetase|nr:tryptophan--tRNA ligase [Methanothrix sp.]OPY55320.1 MAG: Tryptophan--tRNA ligase [Methanosaeta sp. PtaU1.Bin055]NLX39829.1 tryptophan--tRNA ligase [Methanothrix sp.]HNR57274.1 tryptophan--tRNA ligase [Methanothrix sp.]HNT71464.1 tryptophan--tRNA ligase [Methanothrix sp.]